jgi:cell division protein FtsX
MWRASWLSLLGVSFLISFLLFLVNIFLLLTYNVQQFSTNVQEQLGVYLYLSDSPGSQDEVYAQAISLIAALEGRGIAVSFYSKDDAFQILSDKLPDIIGNLEKYGISNPLPATLYVTFSTKEQFETVRTLVGQYSSIITNINDLSSRKSFDSQEQRAAYIISLSRVVAWVTTALVFVIVGVIVAFLLSMTYAQVQRYSAQLDIEKLLWASYWFMVVPFLSVVTVVFVLWYWLHLIYFWWLWSYVGAYMQYVFGDGVLLVVLPPFTWWALVVQFFLFLLVIWVMLYWWLRSHIRSH